MSEDERLPLIEIMWKEQRLLAFHRRVALDSIDAMTTFTGLTAEQMRAEIKRVLTECYATTEAARLSAASRESHNHG